MVQRRASTERLGYFSDAVFAVIITIMVLELKPPPEQSTFGALLPLWPTALSYLVSYYFIAIVWLNHHHLLRFCQYASPRLVWINFVHLFMVSLVPFSTAWIADTKLAAVPVFVYAGVFVLVNLAYIPFEWHALASASGDEISARARRFAKMRSLFTLGTFLIAMLVSLKFPSLGFGLICCALLVYLRPEPPGADDEDANKVTASGGGPSQGEHDAEANCALEV
jgi:TMEM175 potassium channel family protein